MRIREPRAGWVAFLWLWAALFGGIPLVMLISGAARDGDAPVLMLLLFPLAAIAVLTPLVRRSMRAGFTLGEDGIHGAHDAESSTVPWSQVERIAWRWAEETSGVRVNGRRLPDGYALHAVLDDGRTVRLMQRVAPKYGQQQALNEQMAAAAAAGVLPVPFDATIPTHGDGEWSGTPPPARTHTSWDGGDLPPVRSSPLEDDHGGDGGRGDGGGGDDPVWPVRGA